jgi:nucleoside-diphosphate-sugar epimerase
MRALITGGAGFIGSHLAEALLSEGHHVVVLDILGAGSTPNVSNCRSSSRFQYVQGDACNPSVVGRVVRRCDWVFHQAAIPSVAWSVDHPVESNHHNLDATVNVLQASVDAGVRRFVYASSSAVYGDDETAESKHESLPARPLSPYALQKYAGEHYCALFRRLHGLPTVALRYFNVFGPRQASNSAYSGVIARFCSALIQGEEPVIYGDGLQSRDFIHVADVVSANIRAAKAAENSVAGRVFNIAAGESRTLLDLVTGLNALGTDTLHPRFEPARSADVRHSRADTSAARDAFGHRPGVAWTEGLASTLAYYRRQGCPLAVAVKL